MHGIFTVGIPCSRTDESRSSFNTMPLREFEFLLKKKKMKYRIYGLKQGEYVVW